MTEPAHLTDPELAGYRERTLAAADLLRVDEHLAGCSECRDRLFVPDFAAAQIRHLRNDLSEHLDYDQVVACAEGRSEAELEAHLAECDLCRAEVADLREFRTQLGTGRRNTVVMPIRLAVAAGLVVVAGLAVWSLRKQAAPPQIAQRLVPQPVGPREPALPPDQQQAVQLAMASHKLQRAPVLNRLAAKRGVLLGAPAEGRTFEILAPMGITTLTDRPLFQWEPLKGATSYVVAVFDASFNKVAESPALAVPEWQPEHSLGRGRVFNWQVLAHVGGLTVRAPVPPAPEARFEVVSMETAGEIESARREHPGNHLVLAVLCARAGALDEAAKEVDALAASDAGLAHELRQSLEEVRKR